MDILKDLKEREAAIAKILEMVQEKIMKKIKTGKPVSVEIDIEDEDKNSVLDKIKNKLSEDEDEDDPEEEDDDDDDEDDLADRIEKMRKH